MQRNTKTKLLIESTLRESAIPVSLGDLFKTIQKTYPRTAFSTIYRVVSKLKNEQKLIQVDMRDRGSKFEWAEHAHHHHVTCDECGEIKDIDDSVVGFEDKKISSQTGFLVKHHTIEIAGICPNCQKN